MEEERQETDGGFFFFPWAPRNRWQEDDTCHQGGETRTQAGKEMCILSLALLPSASFFSLSMKASPRDPLGAGKSVEICTQAFQVDFPGGLGGGVGGGNVPLPRQKKHQDVGKLPQFCQPLDFQETNTGLKLKN